MNTKLMVAAFAAAVMSVSAFADKVTLKDGSIIIGTAGDFAGDKLKFSSPDAGDLQLEVA